MDIETYQKASEIIERINVCDNLLNAMNGTSNCNTNKVKSALGYFAELYGVDFMLYVAELRKKEQEAFDALQCCSCDKEPEEKEEDGGTTERD